VSDDLPELIGLSNRIVVITNGRISATVDAPPGAKPDEHDLVARMIHGAESHIKATITAPTTVG
jgi:ribose transport system ATP-binding protein